MSEQDLLLQKELIQKSINERNVKFLVKYFFDVDLRPKQVEIVRCIAFSEDQRVVISCMTRYGKSFCVSIGVLLYILFNDNKKILLIAPLIEQAKIIRNYISNFIILSDTFRDLVDIQLTGLDRLKSEVSKKRITFKNGCDMQILSAEGEATRLMGFGGDLIIIDESCLVSYDVYRSKISRMLGDNPNSMLVEIGNPWDRNNQMFEHWTSANFKKIHIDWKDALKEEGITEFFLEEQRKLLTPIEFKVLYEADFPEEAEDSIFSYKSVQKAIIEVSEGFLEGSKKIISCDVADKGKDSTVIMWGYEHEGNYKVIDIYSEPKSENMQIAGKIVQWYEEKGADIINIDTIGVGVGVVSRVREVLNNKGVVVKACHFGEGVGATGKEIQPRADERLSDRKSDSGRKRFLNRKAEQYFRLKDLFEESMMSIPESDKLVKELMSMGWELTSSGKIKVVDPEGYSPDFADCLVYFTWKSEDEVIFDFGG